MAKPNYVITHDSLYLRVNGKLQEMKKGSPIDVDPKTAKRLLARGVIKDAKEAKAVEVGEKKTADKE